MVAITNSYRLLGYRSSSSSYHRRSSAYTSKDNNLLIHRSTSNSGGDGDNGRSIVGVEVGVDSSTSSSSNKLPTPGSPVIKFINKDTNIASMSVAIAGDITQKAYSEACDLFNAEVRQRGYTVPGFRAGAKLPPLYLNQMFGEDNVKLMCGNLMSSAIQDECETTGMMFVGRGRIMDFHVKSFTPGQPHVIDVECDLWPSIVYGGERGYKGLRVTVVKDLMDSEKMEKIKLNIRERYLVLESQPKGYVSSLGDVAVVNMRGYEKTDKGEKGEPLPSVASGDKVEVLLAPGKFMPGMVESLVGSVMGDTRRIEVTFPVRPTGPGAALSGKQAIFDIEVLEVKTRVLPEWNEQLAASIREGMTLDQLNDEVLKAMEGDTNSNIEIARNDALASALLNITSISKLPESLIEENTQSRFQAMLSDFKEQGSTDEEIQDMMTPEKYGKYKELSRKNVEKIVMLGMAFRDIAEKEKVVVTDEEMQAQLDALAVQSKQKGEPMPDIQRAREEIENVLLRKKVFNAIASYAEITYVDPPTTTTE